MVMVWCEATSTFFRHALPLLALAVFVFAGPSLVGVGLAVALGLSPYPHATGPFATYQGIGHITANTALLGVLIIQAGLGLAAAVIGRGAVATLLCRDVGLPVVRALQRWRWLSVGTVLHGALVAGCAIGINAILRDTAADLANVGQVSITLDGAWRVTALRMLDALIASGGSPFDAFVPWGRAMIPSMHLPPSYEQHLFDAYGGAATGAAIIAPAPSSNAAPMLIFLISLLLLLFVEPILQFQLTTAAIRPSAVDTAHWGFQHALAVIVHTWCRRLIVAAALAVFVIAPVVLTEQAMTLPVVNTMPFAALIRQPSAVLICLAAFQGLCAVFGAVYDAQLRLAIVQTEQTRRRTSVLNFGHAEDSRSQTQVAIRMHQLRQRANALGWQVPRLRRVEHAGRRSR
jgi:hypothetical protein